MMETAAYPPRRASPAKRGRNQIPHGVETYLSYKRSRELDEITIDAITTHAKPGEIGDGRSK
jgi:hypothetical protein